MAFLNRGNGPIENNINTQQGDYAHYRRMWRYCYYIPLDNTYVIFQMIVTFIILIVGFIAYIFGYKTDISDPIASVKKTYINLYLISIAFLLIFSFVAHIISKDERGLLEKLTIVFIISLLILFVFVIVKLNFDNLYTRDYFEQFTTQLSSEIEGNNKIKLIISKASVGIKSEKEYYLDECEKTYNIFSTKVYGLYALHMLLNILLIYQITKINKIKNNKERLQRDDIVVYDEEENIKF